MRPAPVRLVRPAPQPPPAVANPATRPLGAAAVLFAACFAYAFVRYVVVKGEPLSSVPLYVTNKAIAVFAIALVAAVAARPQAPWRRFARRAGLAAAVVHGLASLAILGPGYFPKLYVAGSPGRLGAAAEIALLAGGIALAAFVSLLLGRPADEAARRSAARTALVALGLAVVHCAALGAASWLAPAGWAGAMPPMTLLGACAGAGGLAVALVAARRSRR